jgi:nitroimidazol reductase NimA-like FMN-containing flavoprotein (pyridoxamine 5'-phosphate oxidase superfamily)
MHKKAINALHFHQGNSMKSSEQIAQDLTVLFENESLAVLSTRQADQPYASLVAFVATADLKRLLFLTPVTTRKFANLKASPKVALLIHNSRNQPSDIYQAMAVTATGTATALDTTPDAALLDLYLAKHPHLKDFARASTTALVRVDVATYYLVHHFQTVIQYKVTP